MSASATIPTTVTPEAAARIAELGIQGEVDRMLEHTRQTIPNLRRIDVTLDDPHGTGDQPYLTIWATRGDTYHPDDSSRQEWGRWKVTTFPPQVCEQITLVTSYEDGHAG